MMSSVNSGRLKPGSSRPARSSSASRRSTPSRSKARPSTASGQRSRQSSPQPANALKSNDSVAAYVNNCSLLSVEPVLEYVMSLSDPAAQCCNLAGRKKGLAENDLVCLFNSLRETHSITSIDLSSNNLSGSMMPEVASGLIANMSIQTLTLAKNTLHDEGVSHLASALEQNIVLTELDLSDNGVGNSGVADLAQALVGNTHLVSLDLQRNQVGDQGAAALARSAERNRAVKTVNLRFNNIGNAGAAAIGDSLRFNQTLTELDLGGNSIGAAGCEGLSAGLECSQSLTKLNLRSNAAGDRGAAAIGRALTKNSSLVALYLGSNDIGPEGVATVASAWKQNNTLETVDLQGCVMGRSGAAAIADSIRTNHSIRELILEIEQGDRSAAQEIAAALRSNTSLTEIFLGDSGAIDPDIAESFANTLRINKFIAGAGKPAEEGAPEPSVDAVVLAMNERLKGMQTQLNAPAETAAPASPMRSSPVRSSPVRSSPVPSVDQTEPAHSGSGAAQDAWMHKVAAMIDQRVAASPVQSTAELTRLRELVQEQAHKIEQLSVAVATASSKADDAEVTLETIVHEMDSMTRPALGGSGHGLESSLMHAVDSKLAKLRAEVQGAPALDPGSVEGLTEALQQHWERQMSALEQRLTAASKHAAETQAAAFRQQLETVELRLQEQMAQLVSSCKDSSGEGQLVEALENAVTRVRQEARWAQEEAIRVRVEEEAMQQQEQQQLRKEFSDGIAELGRRVAGSEGSSKGLAGLEQELKAAHQASLRALEAKGHQDHSALEQKIGGLVERMNLLEVTMRNEQEASLMALEAILGGKTN